MDSNSFFTKSDVIYSTLKDEIIFGKRHGGERLVAADIANKFQASPMPVREALQRLQLDGLVEIVPYVGARVATLDFKRFNDMVVVRNMLEPVAARLAAKAMSDSDIQSLYDYTNKMEDYCKNGDIEAFTNCNHEFHRAIWCGCGNDSLIEILDNLYSKTEITKTIFSKFPDRMEQSCIDHKKIVDLIKARDAEGAYLEYYQHKVAGFRMNLSSIGEEYTPEGYKGDVDIELPIIPATE